MDQHRSNSNHGDGLQKKHKLFQRTHPITDISKTVSGAAAVPKEDHELSLLWLRFSAARAAMDVWPGHWPMDGWLQHDGDPQPPFPVILVHFNPDGVGIVLGMEHPIRPGHRAHLTTQAHGAGCHHRTVCCQGQEAYFQAMTLHYAALRFESEPSSTRSGQGSDT